MLIAKRGVPFNVVESLVVPAMKEIISTVMERDPVRVLLTVPLSDTKVKRRIDKMNTNCEDQLCEILRNSSFSLQLDSSSSYGRVSMIQVKHKKRMGTGGLSFYTPTCYFA